MKRFLVGAVIALGFAGLLSLQSCFGGIMAKTDQAEATVDSFYTYLQKRDYDELFEKYGYADAGATKDDWLEVFYKLEELGKLESWDQDFGLNTNMSNGFTKVDLNYSCEYEGGTTKDNFVLVDKGSGFKVMGYTFEVITIPEPRLDM